MDPFCGSPEPFIGAPWFPRVRRLPRHFFGGKEGVATAPVLKVPFFRFLFV